MSEWIQDYNNLLKDLIKNQKEIEKNERKQNSPIYSLNKEKIEIEKNILYRQQEEIIERIKKIDYDVPEIMLFNNIAILTNQKEIENSINTLTGRKKLQQSDIDSLVFQDNRIKSAIQNKYKQDAEKIENQLKKSAIPLSRLTNYLVRIKNSTKDGKIFTNKEIEQIEADIEKYELSKKETIETINQNKQELDNTRLKVLSLDDRINDANKRLKESKNISEQIEIKVELQRLEQEKRQLSKETEKQDLILKENEDNESQEVIEETPEINGEQIEEISQKIEDIQIDTSQELSNIEEDSIEELQEEIEEEQSTIPTLESILEEYEKKKEKQETQKEEVEVIEEEKTTPTLESILEEYENKKEKQEAKKEEVEVIEEEKTTPTLESILEEYENKKEKQEDIVEENIEEEEKNTISNKEPQNESLKLQDDYLLEMGNFIQQMKNEIKTLTEEKENLKKKLQNKIEEKRNLQENYKEKIEMLKSLLEQTKEELKKQKNENKHSAINEEQKREIEESKTKIQSYTKEKNKNKII